MADYIIQARSFRLGFASHNFWVLADADSGRTIAELHGLATSRVTGRTVPIGTSAEHSLRVYVFPHEERYSVTLGLPIRVTHMFRRSRGQAAYRGADGLARWSVAVQAIPKLNELDLDYPPYGFNILHPTVNSNSAYRTFGEIMAVPVHRFRGVVSPGLHARVITPQEIESLAFRAGGTVQA